MKVTLQRVNDAVHLQARNEQGNVVDIDGSEKIGGMNLGARPMQLILMGLGGCSSMDVLSILKKMKQEVQDFGIEITAKRDENGEPAVFTEIHLHFRLSGDLDPAKVQKALDLSIQKYCSVSKMLEKTAKITYDFALE